MISLKDFVKETLTQIAEAAGEFNAANKEAGATTKPKFLEYTAASQWSEQGFIYGGANEVGAPVYAAVIAFDIAVTAESSDTNATGAKGGVKVLEVFKASVGGESKSEVANSSVSRVKFSLPLQIS